jgi:hypothetical protein
MEPLTIVVFFEANKSCWAASGVFVASLVHESGFQSA